jgi:parallel beta-helix repeat protein
MRISALVFVRLLFRTGFFLLFALGPAGSALATDYYVATTGDDDNPGTEALPWRTIQKAAGTMVAGDSVSIRAGMYSETVMPQNSGASGQEIVYKAYPNEEVIIKGDPGPSGSTIYLDDFTPLHHLRFDNLTLQAAGFANFYARATTIGPKHHITLDGLTVSGAYLGVVFWTGVTDSEIRNCDLFGNQYNIYLNRLCTDIVIDKNEVHDTAILVPSDFNSNNINLYGATGENRRITISNNHVHHGIVQGIAVFHAEDVIVRNNHCHDNGATGIQIEANVVDGISRRVVVEDNVCENNSRTHQAETGIWIDDTDDVIVQNNVIRGNEIGLQVTGSYRVIARFNTIHDNHRVPFINSSGVRVNSSTQRQGGGDDILVHNTIHRNALNSQRANVVIGVLSSHPPVDHVVFKNNNATESLNDRDLWIQWLTHEIDYNNYFDPPGAGSVVWQESVVDWTTYLAVSGHDANSLTADPLYVDAGGWDFRINPASPCVDAGDFLTRTVGSGSGTTVKVEDARYFSDGMGLIEGDAVQIGTNSVVQIVAVDLDANAITVDQPVAFQSGEGVSYPYGGNRPDMGAYELCFGSSPGSVQPTITLDRLSADQVRVRWPRSGCCGADDYGIHVGVLGSWYSHDAVDCFDDGNDLEEVVSNLPDDDVYLLVVPYGGGDEGSYGMDSSALERPPGSSVCAPQQVLGCSY